MASEERWGTQSCNCKELNSANDLNKPGREFSCGRASGKRCSPSIRLYLDFSPVRLNYLYNNIIYLCCFKPLSVVSFYRNNKKIYNDNEYSEQKIMIQCTKSFRVKVKVLVIKLCLTLRNPMDCSPPGSSVHGILQARILEWVAIPFSRGSS